MLLWLQLLLSKKKLIPRGNNSSSFEKALRCSVCCLDGFCLDFVLCRNRVSEREREKWVIWKINVALRCVWHRNARVLHGPLMNVKFLMLAHRTKDTIYQHYYKRLCSSHTHSRHKYNSRICPSWMMWTQVHKSQPDHSANLHAFFKSRSVPIVYSVQFDNRCVIMRDDAIQRVNGGTY